MPSFTDEYVPLANNSRTDDEDEEATTTKRFKKPHQSFLRKHHDHGGGGGLICAMFCMVVLLIMVLIWAVWATIFSLQLVQAINQVEMAVVQTTISFSATPTVNPDHYKGLTQVGSKNGDYECFLDIGMATCNNTDTSVFICFTPAGPIYIPGGDFPYDDDNDGKPAVHTNNLRSTTTHLLGLDAFALDRRTYWP